MLVRRGLVERWVDKSDRRQTMVRLTASGRKVLADCRRALEDFLEERLASLSAAERKTLDDSLQLVRRVLTNDE
jgi:DNA-binding MarR family transcriptional regulator